MMLERPASSLDGLEQQFHSLLEQPSGSFTLETPFEAALNRTEELSLSGYMPLEAALRRVQKLQQEITNPYHADMSPGAFQAGPSLKEQSIFSLLDGTGKRMQSENNMNPQDWYELGRMCCTTPRFHLHCKLQILAATVFHKLKSVALVVDKGARLVDDLSEENARHNPLFSRSNWSGASIAVYAYHLQQSVSPEELTQAQKLILLHVKSINGSMLEFAACLGEQLKQQSFKQEWYKVFGQLATNPHVREYWLHDYICKNQEAPLAPYLADRANYGPCCGAAGCTERSLVACRLCEVNGLCWKHQIRAVQGCIYVNECMRCRSNENHKQRGGGSNDDEFVSDEEHNEGEDAAGNPAGNPDDGILFDDSNGIEPFSAYLKRANLRVCVDEQEGDYGAAMHFIETFMPRQFAFQGGELYFRDRCVWKNITKTPDKTLQMLLQRVMYYKQVEHKNGTKEVVLSKSNAGSSSIAKTILRQAEVESQDPQFVDNATASTLGKVPTKQVQ